MWFNRGGGINFVQGPGFALEESYTVYPQCYVDLGKSEASIAYASNHTLYRLSPFSE